MFRFVVALLLVVRVVVVFAVVLFRVQNCPRRVQSSTDASFFVPFLQAVAAGFKFQVPKVALNKVRCI